MKYFDIYLKRLNRYGLDYQSRTQAKREKTFEAYLLKSVYKVDFNFEGNVYEGSFEKSCPRKSRHQGKGLRRCFALGTASPQGKRHHRNVALGKM